MEAVVSFIIPVRHHENAPNWDDTIRYLKQTVTAIANQTENEWNCLIVCNRTSETPNFDDNRISYEYVDYEPNRLHEKGDATQEEFYESFRLDKGRRVLAAMNSGKLGEYYMIVDDDDFVHKGLVEYVKEHLGESGWYFHDGYVWGDGGNLLMKFDRFDEKCGSSLIIKSSSFDFSTFNETDLKQYLGSHRYLKDDLKKMGVILKKLPFLGAVYRVGHRNAHSNSKSLLRQFYFNKRTISKPAVFFKRLMGLRFLTNSLKAKFSMF